MKMKKGFTLIELLVVIAIIGILSSVVLASLNGARTKSRDARRQSDMKQMQLALELYFDDNTSYPVLATAGDMPTGQLETTYMPSLPVDPSDGSAYQYQSADGSEYCLGIDVEGDVPDNNDSACATALSTNFAIAP
jgi:type II secretion system protein G